MAVYLWLQASAEGRKYVVCISAVEIYCERLKDLLHHDQSIESELIQDGDHMRIRHKDRARTPVHEVQVRSVADAMHSINSALLSRTTRATRCAPAAKLPLLPPKFCSSVVNSCLAQEAASCDCACSCLQAHVAHA